MPAGNLLIVALALLPLRWSSDVLSVSKGRADVRPARIETHSPRYHWAK